MFQLGTVIEMVQLFFRSLCCLCFLFKWKQFSLILQSSESQAVWNKASIITWVKWSPNPLLWKPAICRLRWLELMLYSHRAAIWRVVGWEVVICMVWSGSVFWGNLWNGNCKNLRLVKFDIWLLSLARGHKSNLSHFKSTCCNKRVKKKKDVYSADGQIVVPVVSKPDKQSVSQAASWMMSTQRYASITSSPTVMQKRSFTAVKFQGRSVQGGTDWRYAPGNLEPFSTLFFMSVLLHCIPCLLLQKKKITKKKIQAFEKLKIMWNTFRTFILKWGAEAACAASVRFGARLIIPNKKPLLSVHTGLGCWIAQLPQRLQFTNSGFIHFDLLLPSTVSISLEL